MTDNEIVKALEICECGYCDIHKCPYRHIEDIDKCTSKLAGDALSLIERQKAEIDTLKMLLSTSNIEMVGDDE